MVYFLKSTKTQIKLKPFFFFFLKNRGHAFVENAMILTWAKIQKKILLFGDVRAPESSFRD